MSDCLTPERRSWNMSRIRSKNTKPEVYLRKLLFGKGLRYRIAPEYIPGHPDIYLKKYKTAIFIHGCFWHRHIGCKYAYTPKSRVDFWEQKFSSNIARDQIVRAELKRKGIRQLVVWECTINSMMKNDVVKDSVIATIESFLVGNQADLEVQINV